MIDLALIFLNFILFWQHKYKKDPSFFPFTQVDDSPDMVRAKMIKPLVSYWFYKDQAKKMLDKYNLDLSDQKLVHALHANQVVIMKLNWVPNW